MHQKSATTHTSELMNIENTKPPSHTGTTETEGASTIISWILQGGVILSSMLIILGLCLLPTRPGGLSVHRVLTFPRSVAEVWDGLLILRPQSIIVLGLVLLIATPVVRVAVSVVAFALEHDYRYVVITLVVLAILVLSFVLGKGGA